MTDVGVLPFATTLAVGAEGVQGERIVAGRLRRVLVGLSPRVLRHRFVQIGPRPASGDVLAARPRRQQGQSFLLPIHTTPSGTNWSVGGVLAGGWKGWFVTIPFNYSWVDLEDTLAEGDAIFTITPRVGRNFVLGDLGNVALFAGGNYLRSELEISGTYRIPVEDQVLTFDYTVQQKNKDAWNLLFGFNWDVNKQFSWNLEYDGFIGTREAFIASVTWRF